MKSESCEKPFSLLIKPAGADCNMRCGYCFYLDRMQLYPQVTTPRMDMATLETLIAGFMRLDMPQHVFGWQGGEPTLMGVDFFRAVTGFQQQYGRPGAVVANGLQTNGTLIDDELAAHLAQYRFLVGVSLDGPPVMHDRYRHFAALSGGQSEKSHAAVLRGVEILRRHGVEFNILTLVSAANIGHAAEVYRYICDQGCWFQQYIPCVEFDRKGHLQPFAINGEAWGKFLCELFDCWLVDGVGRVSVRLFDSILARLTGQDSGTCSMERDCRQYFLVEHNGDVYPCDFFVEQRWRLGNIATHTWEQLRGSELYARFGRRKMQWPAACAACPWLDFCMGDCPKHRFSVNVAGAEPRSRLCAGWRMFFKHAMPEFRRLAAGIPTPATRSGGAGHAVPARNDPCPCGSGRKFKKCCG